MENTENNTKERMAWAPHLEWFITLITVIGGFYMVETRVDCINSRFDQFLIAWHEEAKDFHGRLCAIEERNKK